MYLTTKRQQFHTLKILKLPILVYALLDVPSEIRLGRHVWILNEEKYFHSKSIFYTIQVTDQAFCSSGRIGSFGWNQCNFFHVNFPQQTSQLLFVSVMSAKRKKETFTIILIRCVSWFNLNKNAPTINIIKATPKPTRIYRQVLFLHVSPWKPHSGSAFGGFKLIQLIGTSGSLYMNS